MTANLLTLNSSKSKFLIVGLPQQLARINTSSLINTTTHSLCSQPWFYLWWTPLEITNRFFGMLHPLYGMNSPLISVSLVRHSLLHFHLSHMAVHHLHHLHYHRLHHLLLVQYFILNWRLGCSANPFLHRPFPFLPDWFHGLSDHLMFSFCSTAGFVCTVC